MEHESNEEYNALLEFTGSPEEFWPRFRKLAQVSQKASGSCLLINPPCGEARVLSHDSAKTSRHLLDNGLLAELKDLAACSIHSWRDEIIVVGLPSLSESMLWLVLLGSDTSSGGFSLRELQVLAESFQLRRREKRATDQADQLSEVMDLGLLVGESASFLNAALRLCHHLAAKMDASRTSLAWMNGDDLQLVATSHGGRLSIKTEESDSLIRVMEEAFDQNNEVSFPAMPGSHAISREHEKFSSSREGRFCLSVPVRDPIEHHCLGVVLIERLPEEGSWTVLEAERLRLSADLVAARLSDLHLSSGWLGKRVWRKVRSSSAKLLGQENTGWKLLALSLVVSLLLMSVIRMEHKVRAPFLLMTDAAALVTSPFAGFIDQVNYHLGDLVKQDQVLVTLDRKELLLDEINLLAGRDKSKLESRAYESEAKMAEALMARAAYLQEDAKLSITRHRLSLTEIKAPFDGIVVEGDLRERLFSPVQAGENLFKIVQIKDLLGELQVDERDISYLAEGQIGELAFASRPQDRFEVVIESFEPFSEVREEGNIFNLRVRLQGEPQDWWRPGMSGVCKINVGQASMLWVLTHRTIETIRMWLWI